MPQPWGVGSLVGEGCGNVIPAVTLMVSYTIFGNSHGFLKHRALGTGLRGSQIWKFQDCGVRDRIITYERLDVIRLGKKLGVVGLPDVLDKWHELVVKLILSSLGSKKPRSTLAVYEPGQVPSPDVHER